MRPMRRRTFLKRSTPLLAAPMLLNGIRLNALTRDQLYGDIGLAAATDRVLVIIQLDGGNDGLNTLIPADDDEYYRARPNLAIPKNESLPLEGEPLLRMHPVMTGMQSLFNDGLLAAVENICYPRPNLSHFTGTEIWNTASGPTREEFLTTGWVGRYLQQEFPQYPEVLPDDPPAIEISPATSSAFTMVGASVSMSLTDPDEFYQLVNGGPRVEDDPPPDNRAGREWAFIDSINRQSRLFSTSVRRAAERASNAVTYPTGNQLAESLAIIARLVAGGLGTRIYKVTLRGFDTHTAQKDIHARLLTTLSDAVKAFQDDLIALKVDHRVVGMTYSEFGRRLRENGSGTDHGTAAPHFVFGSMIDGGKVFGGLPDLKNTDRYGNLPWTSDFYCYYASILAPLFGLDETKLAVVLPIGLCERNERIPIYRGITTSVEGESRGVGRMRLY